MQPKVLRTKKTFNKYLFNKRMHRYHALNVWCICKTDMVTVITVYIMVEKDFYIFGHDADVVQEAKSKTDYSA